MPPKEHALDLGKFMDRKLLIKLAGGREVVGVLKGYDQLFNLVLNDAEEYLKDTEGNLSDQTRQIGPVICRGSAVMLVVPRDGTEEIANPFLNPEEPDE